MRRGGNALSWREFRLLVSGLLACDSRLSRRLRADLDDEPNEPTEGGEDE